MKSFKMLLTVVLAAISGLVTAQTMTITNPVLSSPYQVTAGTVVTFKWSAFSNAPTKILTDTSAPTITQYIPPIAAWTQLTNWTGPDANGDYSINITVNSDIWVFGGLNGFLGWVYSNVLPIQVISPMVITASDTMICPTAGNILFTAPTGTGYTYQWYSDTTVISGATSSTYTATTAGAYHCVVNNGTANVTNTITLINYEASFTGAFNTNQMTFTTDQTFASYQWYERVGTGSPVAIPSATANQYTATVTSTAKYYSFEGTTTSGCVISSIERVLIDTLFSTPVVVLNTTFNAQGNICDGTPTSLVTTGNSGFIQWMRNGIPTYSGTDSINLFFGSTQNGTWMVNISPTGWPEVVIASNSVTVNFITLIEPSITGANYNTNFCPGDVIPMILTDEGYTYTWYVHDTASVYNSSHVISVPTGVYQHTFATDKFVTIKGVFSGCITTKTISLQGWANQSVFLSVDNYNQQYLCIDSTVTILFPNWMISDFQSFQWYENISGTWTVLTNDTNSNLSVSAPGEYRVESVPVACPLVITTSDSKIIYSYLNRQPSIYSLQPTMCDGDTVVLKLSGGSSWYAKQWLEANVIIGSGGYERVYQGMLTNTGADTQTVVEYGSYQISTKHFSCPNGLKVKSNIVFIKPTVNPVIDMITPLLVENKHVITWDSTSHYLGCQGEPISYTLMNLDYDTITWYSQIYAGDDDYDWGTYYSSQDTINENLDVVWITAVVTDSNGCRGQSTPMLLDSWVWALPAIQSYNNSELCEPGDSTLMNLAFPGAWAAFQWYLDGVAIPGATNDSIWGKDPGMYVLNVFPSACPTFEMSSGVGPTVKFLYAEILENDTLIYAMPELGYYSYQWFFNGDSVDAPLPNVPWVFPKDSMEVGTYTVAVSNDNCTKLSGPYVWSPDGVKDVFVDDLARVYPNPTNGILTIESDQITNISAITLIDMKGEVVFRINGLPSNTIDISDLSSGVYYLRIESRDGYMQRIKVLKH